jgi:periplasmic divalent cation tolerance protein
VLALADLPEICEVVITAADADWLAGFVRELVERRLVACGQLASSIRSLYRWEGAVQDDAEARVHLHTRTELVDRIVGMTDARHPYEVPCVIALPVVAANPAYAAWVIAETRDPDDPS